MRKLTNTWNKNTEIHLGASRGAERAVKEQLFSLVLNSGQVSFVDKVPGPQEAFKSAQRSRSGQEKLPEF